MGNASLLTEAALEMSVDELPDELQTAIVGYGVNVKTPNTHFESENSQLSLHEREQLIRKYLAKQDGYKQICEEEIAKLEKLVGKFVLKNRKNDGGKDLSKKIKEMNEMIVKFKKKMIIFDRISSGLEDAVKDLKNIEKNEDLLRNLGGGFKELNETISLEVFILDRELEGKSKKK